MKNAKIMLVVVGVIIVISLLVWKPWDPADQAPLAQPQPLKASEGPPSIPQIKHPVILSKNEVGASISIPKLDESDLSIQQRLIDFFGKVDFKNIIISESFIRHFVVFVENAEGKQIPVLFSPLKAAPGELIVDNYGADFRLNESNFKRYLPYVDLAQKANLKKMVNYYRRFYPLFQSAYRDLGVQGYFNDRLIDMIDNLLATPDIKEAVRLRRIGTHFEFANPDLESLSAIQKILLRMGSHNAEIVKEKFKELRKMLIQ